MKKQYAERAGHPQDRVRGERRVVFILCNCGGRRKGRRSGRGEGAASEQASTLEGSVNGLLLGELTELKPGL